MTPVRKMDFTAKGDQKPMRRAAIRCQSCREKTSARNTALHGALLNAALHTSDHQACWITNCSSQQTDGSLLQQPREADTNRSKTHQCMLPAVGTLAKLSVKVAYRFPPIFYVIHAIYEQRQICSFFFHVSVFCLFLLRWLNPNLVLA